MTVLYELPQMHSMIKYGQTYIRPIPQALPSSVLASLIFAMTAEVGRPATRWGEYAEERESKRLKSKWQQELPRIFVPGLPDICEDGITKEVSDAYLIRMKLDEMSRKLVSGIVDDAFNRSPSPEPIYDSNGKRLNTREQRFKEKIVEERAHLIEVALRHNQAFRPPPDYAPQHVKRQRRVYIPLEEYPEYNFIGLIIGPRGNTQKRLEKETRCKISIRGKGSVKDGKAKVHNDPSDNDKLHVLITGETQADVDLAFKLVTELVTPVDDDRNEHKKNQLRELALINGTLRDSELCRHCGNPGHKVWNCPEKTSQSFKPANVICAICGDGGHPTSDCPIRRGGVAAPQPVKSQQDTEFDQFMTELSGRAPGAYQPGTAAADLLAQQQQQQMEAAAAMPLYYPYGMYGFPGMMPQGMPMGMPPGMPTGMPPGMPTGMPPTMPTQMPPGYGLPNQMPPGFPPMPNQMPPGYGYPQQQ
eukprot:TRINITY_DN5236_c0_g1_i1.p1 TRINITY_DN5236_c0_g1~~TRINITY_DN5236_c0_g1_i1.p1  ORF type:complete len:474 (+),score=85.72 TRINITY_DN5236_c0_g1_i1:118-1539(+)